MAEKVEISKVKIQQSQFSVRLPEQIKELLRQDVDRNFTSMNVEITKRLMLSYGFTTMTDFEKWQRIPSEYDAAYMKTCTVAHHNDQFKANKGLIRVNADRKPKTDDYELVYTAEKETDDGIDHEEFAQDVEYAESPEFTM